MCDYFEGVVDDFVSDAKSLAFNEAARLVRSIISLSHKGKDMVEIVEPETGNEMSFYLSDVVDSVSQRLESGKKFTLRLRW